MVAPLALLYCQGHLGPALRDPAEQRISLGLAQRGYTVLSFDPISQGERQQHPRVAPHAHTSYV